MKKQSHHKLILRSEAIRVLGQAELRIAAGGSTTESNTVGVTCQPTYDQCPQSAGVNGCGGVASKLVCTVL